MDVRAHDTENLVVGLFVGQLWLPLLYKFYLENWEVYKIIKIGLIEGTFQAFLISNH